IGRTGLYFAPLRIFGPISLLFFALFFISVCYDVLVAQNLGDKTVLLFTFACNIGMFGALADMIRQSARLK
ncbi:MAG: hypothetical protein ACQKBV_10915, partial [Puniceicoccales bacterium]